MSIATTHQSVNTRRRKGALYGVHNPRPNGTETRAIGAWQPLPRWPQGISMWEAVPSGDLFLNASSAVYPVALGQGQSGRGSPSTRLRALSKSHSCGTRRNGPSHSREAYNVGGAARRNGPPTLAKRTMWEAVPSGDLCASAVARQS